MVTVRKNKLKNSIIFSQRQIVAAISVLFLAVILFCSCKTNFNGFAIKRKYTKGYYFHVSEEAKGKTTKTLNSKEDTLYRCSGFGKKEIIKDCMSLDESKVLISSNHFTEFNHVLANAKERIHHIKKINYDNKSMHESNKQLQARLQNNQTKYNSAQDLLGLFVIFVILLLYLLLVYGWMLLYSILFSITLSTSAIVAIIFGFIMAGLTLTGLYYLLVSKEKRKKVKLWHVLVITEIILPLIALLFLI